MVIGAPDSRCARTKFDRITTGADDVNSFRICISCDDVSIALAKLQEI